MKSQKGDATVRPPLGRGLFYTRDSSGRHETTPGEYVRWAIKQCADIGVCFAGTPAQMNEMIQNRRSAWAEDVFLDWNVAGNQRSRLGLDALFAEIARDRDVSHVLIPRQDRLSRPNDAEEGVELEKRLRRMGITIVFQGAIRGPLKRGERADVGESLTTTVAYDQAGRFRHELAEKVLQSHLNLARNGFSTGGRAKYGFERWLVGIDLVPQRPLKEGESVRGLGYHVIWLPRSDGTYEIRCRIKRCS